MSPVGVLWISKFNLIELITTSEIDRAYAALTEPVATANLEIR
jgi:hypothetical protein